MIVLLFTILKLDYTVSKLVATFVCISIHKKTKHFQWLKKRLLIYFQAMKSAVHRTYVMLKEEEDDIDQTYGCSQPANPSWLHILMT